MNGEEMLQEVRRLSHDDLLADYSDLHRALRRYCQITSFPFLREIDDAAITFRDGVAEYTFADLGLRKLEAIWVQGDEDGAWHLMQEADPLAFESLHNDSIGADGTTEENRPERYRLTGGDFIRIRVTPIPDQTYNGRIDGIVNTPVVGRLTELPGPSEYHPAVARMAAGYHYQHLATAFLRKEGTKSEVDILTYREMMGAGRALEGGALAEMHAFAVRDVTPNRLEHLQWPKTKIAR